MAQEIAGSDLRPIHVGAEEALKVRESEWSFRVRGHVVGALIDENLAPHFESMFTAKNGNHIAELIHTVRADGFRPAQT